MRRDAYRSGREALLRVLVERLKRRGFIEITVSELDEYEGKRPPMVFWEKTDEAFMPDAAARKGGADYLFAVETAASLQTEEAARRIALLAAYAVHYRRHFCLVVPESALEEGKAVLRKSTAEERFIHIVGA